jgi:hypothetical protein
LEGCESGGEGAQSLAEGVERSEVSPIEFRREGTSGTAYLGLLQNPRPVSRSHTPNIGLVDSGGGSASGPREPSRASDQRPAEPARVGTRLRPLKRARRGSSAPPVPWGCEWRPAEGGWTLWRCWTVREEPLATRVQRSRYAGFLSQEGWEVLKGYDYETFLTILGQRLRRHGKR